LATGCSERDERLALIGSKDFAERRRQDRPSLNRELAAMSKRTLFHIVLVLALALAAMLLVRLHAAAAPGVERPCEGPREHVDLGTAVAPP
jgi:hypothetical protein